MPTTGNGSTATSYQTGESTVTSIFGEDHDLINRLTQLYINARSRKRQYYETWRKNYLLINNRMWAESRTPWMPASTDSEIYPIVSTLVAYMTDQEVSFSVSPAATPHTPFASYMGVLANHLQVLMESNYETLDWRKEIGIMLWDAAQFGSGILKSSWDAGSDGGLGNAKINRVDPYTFYPDPHATCIDDSQYFIEVRRMSLDELQRRYPLAFDKVKLFALDLKDGGAGPGDEQRPFIYDQGRYPISNPGALPGGSGVYGLPGQNRQHAVMSEGVFVYECWLRENVVEPPSDTDPLSDLSQDAPLVSDRWRVVVHAAGIKLLDEYAEDLWEYPRHPYSRFCYDDIGEFWGISLVSHLASPQIAVNRLLTSLQQQAELTGNPVFIDPSNSGLSRTQIVNRPGQRLSVNSNASGAIKPEWLTPPSPPAFIVELIQFWITRMENTSGISGIAKGQSPPPRTTGMTVTSVQEGAFVRIRNGLRNLEQTLKEVGNLNAQLIIQNYTVPRTIAIAGPQSLQSTLALSARHFYSPYRGVDEDGKEHTKLIPLKYSLLVSAGADNPTSRQSRISEADTLFAMGAIDGEAVLDSHNYPNREIVTARMQEQALALAKAGQSAQAPGKRQRSKRQT